MRSSPTRRRTLQLGSAGLVAGAAGCLGNGPPEGTLDFERLDRINETKLPDRKRYRTEDTTTFPEYRRYNANNVKTAVILIHPAGFDSQLLQPLATTIANSNAAHVFTPDLRGHGPDPEERGDIGYIGQYEDDLSSLIQSVELAYPDAKVVVGGHGTGGGIVVRFASSRYGSLADGYLLLAPYLGPDSDTTREALGGWANFYMDRIVMLRVLTGFGYEKYSDMTTVEFDMPQEVRNGNETLAHSYRLMESYTPPEDAVESMADIPCLTVAGTSDETAYSDAYESVLADHPNATVDLVDGATHLDLAVTDMAVEPMVDWLREI